MLLSSSSPFENLAPQYYLPSFSHCRRLQLSSIPDGPLCLRWCVARPTLYLSLAFLFHRLRTKRPRDTIWQVRRSVRAPQVPRPGPGAGLASVDCCAVQVREYSRRPVAWARVPVNRKTRLRVLVLAGLAPTTCWPCLPPYSRTRQATAEPLPPSRATIFDLPQEHLAKLGTCELAALASS